VVPHHKIILTIILVSHLIGTRAGGLQSKTERERTRRSARDPSLVATCRRKIPA
jgi:hypothetical protein